MKVGSKIMVSCLLHLKSSLNTRRNCLDAFGFVTLYSWTCGYCKTEISGIKIFDQEFVQGPDRKYRYPKPIRDEIYTFLYESLGEWDFNMPRYSCVEQSAHWRKFHPHIQKIQHKLISRYCSD